MKTQGIWEIFWRFLTLGCISFGGPAAHIGYFRKTFVEQLHWLDDKGYANLVSLSQFLPGPSSSQVGFAIGLRRGGLPGGVAAFLGFTLPSFMLMLLLASSTGESSGTVFAGIVAGLKLLAVVVVADAVISMFKVFCKDNLTITIAVLTAITLWLAPNLWVQLGVLVAAALAGISAVLPESPEFQKEAELPEIKVKWLPVGLFIALFLGLPLLSLLSDWFGLFDAFFRAGSLVFGGGHVVLPLLQQMIGENIGADRFLLGYAAAQAMPGPMFTMATFLGADLSPGSVLLGALLATFGVFLPGFLMVIGFHGAWEALAERPRIAGAVTGINAAVVGLLIAVLYSPVFLSAVHGPVEMALVLAGYMLLTRLKLPILVLVAFFALAGFLLGTV